MYLIHFIQEGGIIELHAPYENVHILYLVKKQISFVEYLARWKY